VAEETGDWVMREMQAPDGGYYATLDADSEGEEGKFYLWTPDQVRALLSAEEYAAFAPLWSGAAAQFRGPRLAFAHRRRTGRSGELLKMEPALVAELPGFGPAQTVRPSLTAGLAGPR
jgi:hypothetical protein